MTAPGRNETVEFPLDAVLDDESMSLELAHEDRKVDVVVWKHVELELFGSPSETALSIGDDPETFESESDRELCLLLEQEQT